MKSCGCQDPAVFGCHCGPPRPFDLRRVIAAVTGTDHPDRPSHPQEAPHAH